MSWPIILSGLIGALAGSSISIILFAIVSINKK